MENTINVYVKFVCQFSGCKSEKIIKNVSIEKFNKMVKGIGTTFNHYENNINFDFKVMKVRQATILECNN